MTGHKKLLLAAVAIAALAVPAVASAVSEHANTEQFPPGYLQINPTTCKFLHKEIDQPTGPTWKNLRQFAIWEDARHDAKLNCLTNRPDHTAGLAGYVQVKATGTGHSVTATCPKGDVVLGGGIMAGEAAGSYPSTTSAWTIIRAHDNHQASITVIATCAQAPASP
jgi:hypothetical protein